LEDWKIRRLENIMTKLSANFSLEEFECHCGCGLKPNQDSLEFKEFVIKLQAIRDKCGFPLRINSGIRCKKYNDSLPNSVPDSAHLKGLAVDIAIMDDRSRGIFLDAVYKIEIHRVGIDKRFIHIDADKTKNNATWLY
jgi:zinc D-Ala-D-Ala carboxypeptidase